jgi:hypothetical protein
MISIFTMNRSHRFFGITSVLGAATGADAFLKDSSPDAYEKVVDRLRSSDTIVSNSP